jgi:hypothetical protein
MHVDAALIREQGVTFAVVVVRDSAIDGPSRDRMATEFGAIWNGVPVVLLAQDAKGGGRFYGRRDLVRFLEQVPLRALPWKRWTVH